MKKFTGTIFVLFVTTLIIPINAENQKSKWKLKKDKNEIKIYTRSKPGHAIKAFKGVTEIDAPMKKLEKIILDIPNHSNWMYNVVSSEVVYSHATRPIQYNVLKAPLIAKRDVIVQWHIVRKADRVILNFKGIKHDDLPPQKGHVRIPLLEGKWELVNKGAGKTQVIYQSRGDPGGKIPVWIINLTIVALPYKTIMGLKKQLLFLQKN